MTMDVCVSTVFLSFIEHNIQILFMTWCNFKPFNSLAIGTLKIFLHCLCAEWGSGEFQIKSVEMRVFHGYGSETSDTLVPLR